MARPLEASFHSTSERLERDSSRHRLVAAGPILEIEYQPAADGVAAGAPEFAFEVDPRQPKRTAHSIRMWREVSVTK